MTQKTKQIGYITAMVISVGSTIGAGIFFKNASIFSNAHGQLGFMIASWVVAALGVLAIAFSLIELSSASKANGITDFTNKFTKKGFAKFVSSYMILVYLPINYFAMSMYAAMSLQDAIATGSGYLMDGWLVAAIGFAFYAWFIIIGFFQKKIAIGTQMLYTVVKFIPLIVVIFFAFAQIDKNGGVATTLTQADPATGLTGVSPWLGIMASIPAILFAFDGFYCVTAIKSDLKEPKKMGLIIALSLSVITASYLIFGIITGLAGAKDINHMSTITKTLNIMFNIFIMFAVFGIINGFGIATPELYYIAYKEHPIGFTRVVKKMFRLKDGEEKLATWIVSAGVSLLFFIVLVPVGALAMGPGAYEGAYASNAASLFTLTDYITNYTSLAVFVFIGGAIFGGLVNRKTKKVEVEKSKNFVWVSIVALVFLAVGTIYMIVSNIVGMTGFKGADSQTQIIEFAILAGTTLISLVPNAVDWIKKGLNKKPKLTTISQH